MGDPLQEPPVIEHVVHSCNPPCILQVPQGAQYVIASWRCSICGQRWGIKSQETSGEATSYRWFHPYRALRKGRKGLRKQ